MKAINVVLFITKEALAFSIPERDAKRGSHSQEGPGIVVEFETVFQALNRQGKVREIFERAKSIIIKA